MSQDAHVIQGRLGWESGDVSQATVDELEPHPKNVEIYGDTDDVDDLEESFVESVREKGVLEPLAVTNGKTIISGHRRWLAAKHVGVDRVPVRYCEFDSDLAEREALIEFNRQREKTPGQLVNEFEEILEIEQKRAKERTKEAGSIGGRSGNEGSGSISGPLEDSGEARDKAAEKVGADVSGRTLEKGLKVKEKAEEGDETATDEWEKLETGEQSFSGAYDAVNESDDDEDEDDESDIDPFVSQQSDEWSSPREVVEPLDEAIGGFDLDPCSGAEQSPFADETYTEDDDGLAQPWFGRVWVNPPYSAMDDWTAKAIDEAGRDDVETVVYLCKGDSSTQWWQDAAEACTLITAIDGRLSFGDGGNAAPFASHIICFGEVTSDLVDALDEQGANLVAASEVYGDGV